MLLHKYLFFLAIGAGKSFCRPASSSSESSLGSPEVSIKNGTVAGVYNEKHHQDFFLGIPYAQPPTGNLRFRKPVPLDTRWDGVRDAAEYGPFCHGHTLNMQSFDQPLVTYPMSEDCLTINVVRPAGITPNASLPVLVWIYGGGFGEGGSGDQRYNMSFLVDTSVENHSPMIMVSFNYRLSGWGFLAGSEIEESGNANAGLHDQRLALAWIQENIGNFGGDPTRVTIQGESAGAASVGFHLIAYGGRDGGLFSAAIAESGGPFGYQSYESSTSREEYYNSVLNVTGCSTANNTLACLRAAPNEALDEIFGHRLWYPTLDGTLIPDLNSKLLRDGHFVKVPLLIGANTNDGSVMVALLSSIGVNSTEGFYAAVEALNNGNPLSNATLQRFDKLYQDIVDQEEESLGPVLPNPGFPYGSLYGKTSLVLGDGLFVAGRRFAAQMWAKFGVHAYSFRFDTVPSGIDPSTLGAAHIQEIAFVFRNTEGVGYQYKPFAAQDAKIRQQLLDLAETMSSAWVSFVTTHSPNNGKGMFGQFTFLSLLGALLTVCRSWIRRTLACILFAGTYQHGFQCNFWQLRGT